MLRHVTLKRQEAAMCKLWDPELTRTMGELSVDFEYTPYGKLFNMKGVKSCRTRCAESKELSVAVADWNLQADAQIENGEWAYRFMGRCKILTLEDIKPASDKVSIGGWTVCPLCKLPIPASKDYRLMPIHRNCTTKFMKSKLKYTPPLPDHGRELNP